MPKSLERVLAFIFGVAFVAFLVAVALLVPNPTEFQYIVFRIVLALAAAGVAVTFSGFLHITVSTWIKAGGALAVFVIVFFYNPARLVVQPEAEPEAVASQLLNFDTVNTYGDPKTPVDAEPYLGGFEIEIQSVSAGTRVVLQNHLGSYEGKAFLPVSQPNVLTQTGSNDPVSFTLAFRRPLSKLSFVIPPLVAATKSGITFPSWSARAIDSRGNVIASAAGDAFGSKIQEKMKTVVLAPEGGRCITSVRFDSDNHHRAAFSAILIDDMSLWHAKGECH